jgi:hypothetical protein
MGEPLGARASRTGNGGDLAQPLPKIFISRFNSEQQFKSCGRVHSVSYAKVASAF